MQKTELRALLVDLDGTLVDTAHANYAAYAQALREAGASISREEFDAVAYGRNWRDFVPEILKQASSSANADAVALRKRELYLHMLDATEVNRGLVMLILAWHEQHATALVTTASRSNVEALLAHHALTTLFDTVVTGDDVQQHKPHPGAYLLAANQLQVRAEQCLVFEDSDIGVTSATAAGMQVIRVSMNMRTA